MAEAGIATLPGEVLGDEPGPGEAACRWLYRRLTAGVAVVTATGRDGPVGMTATALTSLSLRPPLLLACLGTGTRTLAAIRRLRAFAVHLLGEDQQGVADAFARPGMTAAGKFAGLAWRDVLGVPVLPDTLAWSVCLLTDERTYGDHSIVVGRVVAIHCATGRPLVWHDRGYWRMS